MEKQEFLQKFSDFVLWRRTRLGLSQTELARLIDSKGINNNYISRLEKKSLEGCTIQTFCLIMEALHSTIIFKPLDDERG